MQNMNPPVTRYNINSFFKDVKIGLGITCAFIVLDMFIKWIDNLSSYEHYNDLKPADWKGIGIATLLTSGLMIIALFFKNLFFSQTTSRLKDIVTLTIPPILLFGCELLVKYLTDFRNDKPNPEINSRDLTESTLHAVTLFAVLTFIVLIKNCCDANRRLTIRTPLIMVDADTDIDGKSFDEPPSTNNNAAL